MKIIPGNRYRIKYNTPTLGLKAGDVGIAMENDFDKYDAFLDFGTLQVTEKDLPSFLKGLKSIKRVYYFYACEIEEA